MGYVFDPAAVLSGQYLDWFLWGLATTIALTVAAWLLAMVLGVILTVIRMVPFKPFEGFVWLYVEYHRNVPLLVQIFVWYFGIPQLLPRAARVWINAHDSEFIFATIALGLASAAYISEDLRSGIRSIPKTQYEAARSIGFNYLQSMGWVILPQAFRLVIPPLINQTLPALQEHEPCHGHRRGRTDLPHPGGRQLHLQDVRGLCRGHDPLPGDLVRDHGARKLADRKLKLEIR